MKKSLHLFTVLAILLVILTLVGCVFKPNDPVTTTTTTTTTAPPDDPVIPDVCEHTGGTPTCTEQGFCSLCGDAYLDALGHTEVIDNAVKSTCKETGLTMGKHCSVCETVLITQIEIPLAAHIYDDRYDESCNYCAHIRDIDCDHPEVIELEEKLPTCTQEGLSAGEKCAKCGEILIEQQVSLILPHTEVIDAAVEPTCTTSGLTEGKHCSECGTVTLQQNTIPALGHSMVTEPAVDATCESDGLTEGRYCSTCQMRTHSQEKVSALGHDWADATCSAPKTCKRCDKTEGTKLEHIYDGDDDPTCNSCGFRYSVGLKYTELEDGTYSVAMGDCTDTEVVIPSTYKGKAVTQLDYGAFRDCKDMVSCIIPDSVTYINDSAFTNCKSLKSIVIPDSVTYIGYNTFYYCSKLESITLPFIGNSKRPDYDAHFGYIFGATSYSTNINCVPTSLKTVVITKATEIGYAAFMACDQITSITLPDSVTSIGDKAFMNCDGLTTLRLPSDLTSIGAEAFSSCEKLESITIPASVTKIGKYAFYCCNLLTSIVFEDPTTWHYTTDTAYTGGTEIDVTVPATNASNFVTTFTYTAPYCSRYLYKE